MFLDNLCLEHFIHFILKDLTDEKEFYAEIRDNHRQQEKAINDWAEYIARTSKHPILKAAKQKQEQSVEASRIATKHKPG